MTEKGGLVSERESERHHYTIPILSTCSGNGKREGGEIQWKKKKEMKKEKRKKKGKKERKRQTRRTLWALEEKKERKEDNPGQKK